MSERLFVVPESMLLRLTMRAASASGYLTKLAPEHSTDLWKATTEICEWVASGKALVPAPEVK